MDKKYDELVVDGRNSIYRAVFAGLSNNNKQYISILSRLIISNIKRFTPKVVNIMWDYDGTIWRSKKYPPYKDRSVQRKKFAERYGVDVSQVVRETVDQAKKYFSLLGFRQYEFKYQEADDLIYTYCDLNKHKTILVLSSDNDMSQISYKMPNISIYNPLKSEFMESDGVDPVTVKCLMGDVSDNIKGFKGVGPVKAKVMAKDEDLRTKFLNEGDGSRWNYYKLYELLIDLSKNPFYGMNKDYIINELSSHEVTKFSMRDVQEFIREHKQISMLEDLSSIKKALECIQVLT